MTASPHVMMLSWERDQYELRTRVKVRGPLTTLKNAWTEDWQTSKFKAPIGIWYDPDHPTFIRVLDRGTKYLYRVHLSDRKILAKTYLGASLPHPGGLSGDPANSAVYWALEAPWRTTGTNTGNRIKKFRKSDNKVLASWALPNGRWTSIKAGASALYLTNLDSDKIHKRSKTTGGSIASYVLKVNTALPYPQTATGTSQTNPQGVMIDGTTLYSFWSNGGSTARFLVSTTGAPRTITGLVATAGTKLHGGEMNTTTHVACWGFSDALHLVAQYTFKTPVANDVAQEAIDIELEDELGALAQVEPRWHDAHPLDAPHAYLVRRETMSITEVTSLAQAMQVAQLRLEELNHRRDVLDVGVVGNPALQKTDLIRVTDPLVGMTVDGRVDTIEMDMAADGTYVGVLALLPQAVTITDVIDDEGSSEDDPSIDVNDTPDTSDPGPDD